MTVKALNHNCIGCLARIEAETGEEATLTVVVMLRSNWSTPESIYDDLCFAHRRYVDDAVRAMTD